MKKQQVDIGQRGEYRIAIAFTAGSSLAERRGVINAVRSVADVAKAVRAWADDEESN